MSLATGLQAATRHPLAEALRVVASRYGVTTAALAAARALLGRGVAGALADGRAIALGNAALLGELRVPAPSAPSERANARARELAASGHTVSWLVDTTASNAPRLLAWFAFIDTVRPAARAALDQLRRESIHLVILTGDSAGAAARVAGDVGVSEVHAELSLARKAEWLAKARAKGATTAMVADGINDAPALAAADVGIAIAERADAIAAASETAGITLMSGELARVADAIEISRRTYRKIRQNLFWAFIYNLVGIPLAVLGILNPVLAGAAMAASSVSVIINALLLRRWRPHGAGALRN